MLMALKCVTNLMNDVESDIETIEILIKLDCINVLNKVLPISNGIDLKINILRSYHNILLIKDEDIFKTINNNMNWTLIFALASDIDTVYAKDALMCLC